MFKSGKVLIIVDSVEKAVKFYTEKLLFCIAELECDDEGGIHLSQAEVKKGKFQVMFRLPSIDELAEFSMIRRCTGRATAAVAMAKKGIDSYYKTCKKKGLEVSVMAESNSGMIETFSVKDPFGLKLVFTQVEESAAFNKKEFCGMDLYNETVLIKKDADVPEKMVKWLRGFGISRRVAKKYVQLWAIEVN
jgi:hypothetical protein